MVKKTMGKPTTSAASGWWAERHKILASLTESEPIKARVRKVKARKTITVRKAAKTKIAAKAKKVPKVKKVAKAKKAAKIKKATKAKRTRR